jgi:hypothetical protein
MLRRDAGLLHHDRYLRVEARRVADPDRRFGSGRPDCRQSGNQQNGGKVQSAQEA